MPRRNNRPLPCECIEIRPHLLEILLGVQVEQRRARACAMDLDGDAPDIARFHFDRPVHTIFCAGKCHEPRSQAPMAPLTETAASCFARRLAGTTVSCWLPMPPSASASFADLRPGMAARFGALRERSRGALPTSVSGP